MKIIAQNKKAFFDYEILDRIEAGIVLNGDEVKALREGNCSLIGSFATFHKGELSLINATIAPYSHSYAKDDKYSTRSRKLLLHKREISRLIGDVSKKGITIVPLKIYFNNKNFVKVELGIAKHKKATDKKQVIKERDIKRETRRELKGKYRI